MRMRALICLVAVGLCGLAWAQDRPAPDGADGARRQQRGGQRGPGLDRLSERLTSELQLSELQQQQLGEIVQKNQQQAEQDRERGGQMRELMQDMRTARDEGNQERVREIQQQLREMRGAGGDPRERFLDDVEKILSDEQVKKLSGLREKMGQEMRQGMAERMQQGVQQLKQQLNLDPTQAQQFDEIAAQQREKMQQGGEQWGELGRQMREARRSGDQQKAEQLQEQFDQMRDGRMTAMQGAFDQLATILNAEQKQILEEHRQQMGQWGPGGGGPNADRGRGQDDSNTVRGVLRAARRVRDLTKEQRDKLDDIQRDAQAGMREVRSDKEGEAMLATRVKAQVHEVLTAEQAQEFDKALHRDNAPRERQRGERGRQLRPGEPAPTGAPGDSKP